MSKETPCIAVCMIDPKTNLCFGCGRTLPEIARWHRMESAERLAVMAQLAGAHGGGRPARRGGARRRPTDRRLRRHGRRAVSRFLLVLLMLAAHRRRRGRLWRSRTDRARQRHGLGHAAASAALEPAPAVQIPRGQGGEFALHAKINGVKAPMVIDTGATSVVLTWETAKAIGLPLEMLEYDVDVETAGGHTKAARLTLDRLAVGKLVEKSVPALVVPRGQMKTNLLGMSFLDRLESWGVRPTG